MVKIDTTRNENHVSFLVNFRLYLRLIDKDQKKCNKERKKERGMQ